MPHRLIRLGLIAALLFATAGCRDAKVTTYRIPKEKDSAPAASAAPSAGDTTVALSWQAPAGWTAKAPTATRKGSYQVGVDGDLSITAFPGDAGGELANINRWRGQVGAPPLAAATPSEASGIGHLDSNGLHIATVEVGGGGQRILGAIVPVGTETWFFKLMGSDAPIAAERTAFLEFLKSVKAK